MIQSVTHLLHNFVSLVYVRIGGETEFGQNLGMGKDDVGDEALGPVLKFGACHPHLSCLVHQDPGHGGPLRPQQAPVGEGLDTALDESLAPLIATELP